MQLILMYCQDEAGVIGVNGELPWHCKSEMAWFKESTMGSVVVMGRKTWESLPDGPLEGRLNIVVTHAEGYKAPGAMVYNDYLDVLKDHDVQEKIFVIGGGQILKLYEPHANWAAVSTLGLAVKIPKGAEVTRFKLEDDWLAPMVTSKGVFRVSLYPRKESREIPFSK